jgi:hypothetical protein
MNTFSQVVNYTQQPAAGNDTSDANDLALTVSTMAPAQKLEYLCNLLATSVAIDEQIMDLTEQGWALLMDNDLWKERFHTLEEFKVAVGYTQFIEPILEKKKRSTEKRITSYAELIHGNWGHSAEEVLGSILPTKVTYSLWAALFQLSCLVPVGEVKNLLEECISSRVRRSKGGRASSQKVLLVDITSVQLSYPNRHNVPKQLPPICMY